MHFEILVEELSAEKLLHNLLPEIITGEHTYRIITHQGKKDLLLNLPKKLKGYSKWIGKDYKIIILIDKDNDDCGVLKQQLETFAVNADLKTKSSSKETTFFHVLNRIAIEEIEAWFFGDPEAVRITYPRVSGTFEKKTSYRNPDTIIGGTWEHFEKILQSAGYFKTGLRKTEAAQAISLNMKPLNNSSKSFQVFWEGISACLANI